jgi:uncharacterized membrane-anchored protein
MKPGQLDQIMQEAVRAGILPADAARPDDAGRPWPVVLLTALGAWLAALPLLGVTGMLFGRWVATGPGPYIVGLLVLAGALVVLRSAALPLFVEQLAVPALLVGGGTLAFGFERDLPPQSAGAILALISILLGWAQPRPWLRVLAGALAASLTVQACLPGAAAHLGRHAFSGYWLALHAVFSIWLAVHAMAHRRWRSPALEALAAGWILATLAGLALWSGMTFLIGGFGGDLGTVLANGTGRASAPGWEDAAMRAASVGLAAIAALWSARQWPVLRQVPAGGVGLILTALAWFMPTLGAALLALAFCATSGRRRSAVAAASAAAWIIGAFYYQLSWPLADKAALLAVAGALLGALAWLAWRAEAAATVVAAPDLASATAPRSRTMQPGIALCALAVLAVANVGIWQKEDLIAHGQPVYVELAPADPRSLMQGDYMRLNFAIPGGLAESIERAQRGRPRAVARQDARGVATLLRLDDGGPLAADELRIELTPKNGRWTLVSDAWFFKEGEGARWAAAKYGEFRVGPDGRALLVGLRGPNLEKL